MTGKKRKKKKKNLNKNIKTKVRAYVRKWFTAVISWLNILERLFFFTKYKDRQTERVKKKKKKPKCLRNKD